MLSSVNFLHIYIIPPTLFFSASGIRIAALVDLRVLLIRKIDDTTKILPKENGSMNYDVSFHNIGKEHRIPKKSLISSQFYSRSLISRHYLLFFSPSFAIIRHRWQLLLFLWPHHQATKVF
ncbi:hypothetical protein RIF29_36000 [Crotalaria pallida]|uniref:Uncharacterized protein n=1 Tax=Crotalaria pallida TaxID=3830 RepID=A0AAN9EAL1_CROPI